MLSSMKEPCEGGLWISGRGAEDLVSGSNGEDRMSVQVCLFDWLTYVTVMSVSSNRTPIWFICL